MEGAAGYDISLYDITDGVGYPEVNYLVTGTSYDISFNIEEGRKYAVSLSTISGDLTKYTSGDESDLVEWISDESNKSNGSETSNTSEPVNMMQGRLFFDAVEAAAPDYSVARTYNIRVDNSLVYETEIPAMFVLSIPETYLATNREYKMVCVSKDGEVIVFDDLDTAAETISFLTNKFYAFALVYRDTIVE